MIRKFVKKLKPIKSSTLALRRYEEISLNFPELFIIGKYVKIRFKNGVTMVFSQFERSIDQQYYKK